MHVNLRSTQVTLLLTPAITAVMISSAVLASGASIAASMGQKFPAIRQKLPVLQNIFPVILRRELRKKPLRHSGFLR